MERSGDSILLRAKHGQAKPATYTTTNIEKHNDRQKEMKTNVHYQFSFFREMVSKDLLYKSHQALLLAIMFLLKVCNI